MNNFIPSNEIGLGCISSKDRCYFYRSRWFIWIDIQLYYGLTW